MPEETGLAACTQPRRWWQLCERQVSPLRENGGWGLTGGSCGLHEKARSHGPGWMAAGRFRAGRRLASSWRVLLRACNGHLSARGTRITSRGGMGARFKRVK